MLNTSIFHSRVKVFGFWQIQTYINRSQVLLHAIDGQQPLRLNWPFTALYITRWPNLLFWPALSVCSHHTLSFRTATLTKLLGNYNQNSGAQRGQKWLQRYVVQCFQVGTIKIQCHHGSLWSQSCSLATEQIVFHIINAFSKEWQIKCGSN